MVDKKKFVEEEALGYRIEIVGRNLQVTEAMKNYAWEKLSKIERFHSHIMNVHVTLDIQKLEHVAVVVIKFDHFKIKVQASSTDMYASIDKAVDRLQTMVRKWRSKIQDHHKKAFATVDMQVNVLQRPYDEVGEINAEIESAQQKVLAAAIRPLKVVGSEKRPLKILNKDEAIMKMELSQDLFLVYRAEEDQKLKVIYRRADGNYGIIQPE